MTLRVLLFWMAMALPLRAGEQLPNLDETAPKSRFPVKERDWPSQPGQASVCLWKDDKTAALSITVDDNCAPDVPWWIEMSEKYRFPVTWFLITGKIDQPTASFSGTWKIYADALARGHAVESHTKTHLHVDEPGWKDIEWEYTESLKEIEAGLPGHKARFLAYPGGPNSKFNDRTVAAKYYAAARGTVGIVNQADRIDYMNVGLSYCSFDKPEIQRADVRGVLEPTHKGYRGWSVVLFHFVKEKEAAIPLFEFAAAKQEELWVGLFGDVARYGQERDTATLAVTQNTPGKIAFGLADRMEDGVFDHPLTVKVRLPDGWKNVKAQQAGKPLVCRFVLHEGMPYALVDAVPDRGEVELSEG